MPVLSRFYGIIIRMYFLQSEHNPPHIHAIYNEDVAAIDFMTGEQMLSHGHAEHLTRLQNELINKDWFQTLPDFNSYVVRKNQAVADYAQSRTNWMHKALINISKAGFFSSDRTIEEYNRDIWKL